MPNPVGTGTTATPQMNPYANFGMYNFANFTQNTQNTQNPPNK